MYSKRPSLQINDETHSIPYFPSRKDEGNYGLRFRYDKCTKWKEGENIGGEAIWKLMLVLISALFNPSLTTLFFFQDTL